MVGLIQAFILTRQLSWAKFCPSSRSKHSMTTSGVDGGASTTLLSKHLACRTTSSKIQSENGLFTTGRGTNRSSDDMNDYYSIWGLNEPSTVSYQVDRRLVERDFTKWRNLEESNSYGKVKKIARHKDVARPQNRHGENGRWQ